MLRGLLRRAFSGQLRPLPVAFNRLTKEETPLTFFTLLACYFYCRAQQADADQTARRWYDLSAIGFGLSLASQYILHLLGLNALAWLIAGKMGLTREPSRFSYRRFFLVLFITFILVNPVILSPANFNAILHWLHHDGVKHSGYDFDGTLYMNFPSRLLAGVPWFYYFWLVLVKTPIPILMAVIVGSALLLRDRRTPRVVFLSIARGGSIGRAVCQWSQVDPIFTPAPALPLPGRRICGATNAEGCERKSPVAGPCGPCRRHFAWMAAP